MIQAGGRPGHSGHPTVVGARAVDASSEVHDEQEGQILPIPEPYTSQLVDNGIIRLLALSLAGAALAGAAILRPRGSTGASPMFGSLEASSPPLASMSSSSPRGDGGATAAQKAAALARALWGVAITPARLLDDAVFPDTPIYGSHHGADGGPSAASAPGVVCSGGAASANGGASSVVAFGDGPAAPRNHADAGRPRGGTPKAAPVVVAAELPQPDAEAGAAPVDPEAEAAASVAEAALRNFHGTLAAWAGGASDAAAGSAAAAAARAAALRAALQQWAEGSVARGAAFGSSVKGGLAAGAALVQPLAWQQQATTAQPSNHIDGGAASHTEQQEGTMGMDPATAIALGTLTAAAMAGLMAAMAAEMERAVGGGGRVVNDGTPKGGAALPISCFSPWPDNLSVLPPSIAPRYYKRPAAPLSDAPPGVDGQGPAPGDGPAQAGSAGSGAVAAGARQQQQQQQQHEQLSSKSPALEAAEPPRSHPDRQDPTRHLVHALSALVAALSTAAASSFGTADSSGAYSLDKGSDGGGSGAAAAAPDSLPVAMLNACAGLAAALTSEATNGAGGGASGALGRHPSPQKLGPAIAELACLVDALVPAPGGHDLVNGIGGGIASCGGAGDAGDGGSEQAAATLAHALAALPAAAARVSSGGWHCWGPLLATLAAAGVDARDWGAAPPGPPDGPDASATSGGVSAAGLVAAMTAACDAAAAAAALLQGRAGDGPAGAVEGGGACEAAVAARSAALAGAALISWLQEVGSPLFTGGSRPPPGGPAGEPGAIARLAGAAAGAAAAAGAPRAVVADMREQGSLGRPGTAGARASAAGRRLAEMDHSGFLLATYEYQTDERAGAPSACLPEPLEERHGSGQETGKHQGGSVEGLYNAEAAAALEDLLTEVCETASRLCRRLATDAALLGRWPDDGKHGSGSGAKRQAFHDASDLILHLRALAHTAPGAAEARARLLPLRSALLHLERLAARLPCPPGGWFADADSGSAREAAGGERSGKMIWTLHEALWQPEDTGAAPAAAARSAGGGGATAAPPAPARLLALALGLVPQDAAAMVAAQRRASWTSEASGLAAAVSAGEAEAFPPELLVKHSAAAAANGSGEPSGRRPGLAVCSFEVNEQQQGGFPQKQQQKQKQQLLAWQPEWHRNKQHPLPLMWHPEWHLHQQVNSHSSESSDAAYPLGAGCADEGFMPAIAAAAGLPVAMEEEHGLSAAIKGLAAAVCSGGCGGDLAELSQHCRRAGAALRDQAARVATLRGSGAGGSAEAARRLRGAWRDVIAALGYSTTAEWALPLILDGCGRGTTSGPAASAQMESYLKERRDVTASQVLVVSLIDALMEEESVGPAPGRGLALLAAAAPSLGAALPLGFAAVAGRTLREGGVGGAAADGFELAAARITAAMQRLYAGVGSGSGSSKSEGASPLLLPDWYADMDQIALAIAEAICLSYCQDLDSWRYSGSSSGAGAGGAGDGGGLRYAVDVAGSLLTPLAASLAAGGMVPLAAVLACVPAAAARACGPDAGPDALSASALARAIVCSMAHAGTYGRAGDGGPLDSGAVAASASAGGAAADPAADARWLMLSMAGVGERALQALRRGGGGGGGGGGGDLEELRSTVLAGAMLLAWASNVAAAFGNARERRVAEGAAARRLLAETSAALAAAAGAAPTVVEDLQSLWKIRGLPGGDDGGGSGGDVDAACAAQKRLSDIDLVSWMRDGAKCSGSSPSWTTPAAAAACQGAADVSSRSNGPAAGAEGASDGDVAGRGCEQRAVAKPAAPAEDEEAAAALEDLLTEVCETASRLCRRLATDAALLGRWPDDGKHGSGSGAKRQAFHDASDLILHLRALAHTAPGAAEARARLLPLRSALLHLERLAARLPCPSSDTCAAAPFGNMIWTLHEALWQSDELACGYIANTSGNASAVNSRGSAVAPPAPARLLALALGLVPQDAAATAAAQRCAAQAAEASGLAAAVASGEAEAFPGELMAAGAK